MNHHLNILGPCWELIARSQESPVLVSLVLRRQRRVDFCEFKVDLVYTVSSKPSSAMLEDPSQKKENQTKQKGALTKPIKGLKGERSLPCPQFKRTVKKSTWQELV